METTKIALIGIIIHDMESVAKTNDVLHKYAEFVVGRMGIPYSTKGVNIISIVLDAPENIISAIAGKLGQIDGISVKSMVAKGTQKL